MGQLENQQLMVHSAAEHCVFSWESHGITAKQMQAAIMCLQVLPEEAT